MYLIFSLFLKNRDGKEILIYLAACPIGNFFLTSLVAMDHFEILNDTVDLLP